MKKETLVFLVLASLCSPAWGQNFETDTEAQAEISKLRFIVGEWEGTGWMMGRDGKKHLFNQTEKVQFKIDSTALLIEGMGKTGGKTTHNALAIVSFDKEAGHYNFRSYLSSGRKGSFKAELKENKFYWYPRENMRYIIYLNDKGQWYELGEMNRGGQWFQFFEMTLDKKEDSHELN